MSLLGVARLGLEGTPLGSGVRLAKAASITRRLGHAWLESATESVRMYVIRPT